MLKAVRSCVEFAPCDTSVLDQAIDSEFKDFEDAVQYFSARAAGAEVIITRNQSHFAASQIPVMPPSKFLTAHRPGS